ncbi:MAG: hypothetical protein HYX63_01580 [Gammaproteobacteria bacterium]|nr:hypothetical protein [Gammaproteobacteria bacterium]
MASKVSICSNALLMLGVNPIASFDEDSQGAVLASNLWEDVKNATLRSHPWNCATKRVSLAPESTTPAYEWPYSYLLPGDWLRTLSVGEETEDPAFVMENGRILFDESELKLRYVFKNDDLTTWDTLLILAQTTAMAVAFAYPVTKSAALQTSMETTLAQVLQKARGVNGSEDTGETFGDSPLLNARYAQGSRTGLR